MRLSALRIRPGHARPSRMLFAAMAAAVVVLGAGRGGPRFAFG
jgi:hypothetical protein